MNAFIFFRKNHTVLNLLLTLVISLFVNQESFAGYKEGNGGDSLRATFFAMGESVLAYLNETPEGKQLVTLNQIDTPTLKETLSIQTVKVVDNFLVDNGGSIVDAIGTKGSIQLFKDRWFEYFETGQDVYYLVFHEMLRAAGIHDDDFIISKNIAPFPFSRKIETRISSGLPLLKELTVDKKVTFGPDAKAGSGCPAGTTSKTLLDTRYNTITIIFDQFMFRGFSQIERLNCSFAQAIHLAPQKRIRITQVEAQGEANLKPKSKLSITHSVFTAGLPGSSQSMIFRAEDSDSSGSILMRTPGNYVSPCGQDFNLRLSQTTEMQSLGSEKSQANIRKTVLYFSVEDCLK